MSGQKEASNAAEFDTKSDDIFGRIAGRYDRLCDLFSFGIHRRWKREVAKVISSESWNSLLDTATGTGDIIIRVMNLETLSSERTLVASDISPQMLQIAKKRLRETSGPAIELKILDAQNLHQIESNSFDCYSMSLGMKICNRRAAIEEAIRVIKPGGRIVILEASNISIPWLHKAYLVYMEICMSVIGWIATLGDASAYKYLLQGIREFPFAEDFKRELFS